MAKKTRREIREAFKSGAQPSGADFQNFIESTLNIKDDGIEKQGAGLPVKMTAAGSNKNILDLYDAATHTWRVNMNPGNKAGLNIEDSSQKSRLFIQDGDGNTGISTSSPKAKLHVVQSDNSGDAFRIDDEATDATPFVVTGGGTVGIGTAAPDTGSALHVTGKIKVDGAAQLKSGVSINAFSADTTFSNTSDDAVPTQKAVKTYVDNAAKTASDNLTTKAKELNVETAKLAFPVGGIIMWTGASAPSGWALCDGKEYDKLDGSGKIKAPDLKDKFVLGTGINNPGATGGEKNHQLTGNEIPAHKHGYKNTYWSENADKGGKDIGKGKHKGAAGSTDDDNLDLYHDMDTEKTGKGEAHNNMPPYHVLAFIMKL